MNANSMYKNTPLVSIAIPCYNHQEFVQECIQSVINQDYKNIELIIIDDDSKDNSIEKIKELIPVCKRRFVRFEFRSQKNKGLCRTLNECLDWCKGEYFSGLASDDFIKPYKISHQVNLLNNHPEYIGVFGATEIIYNNGDKIAISRKPKEYNFVDIFLHKHNLPALTQLLRLNDVKVINGFRDDFIIEDWMMFLDLTKKGGLLYADGKVVASYRRHEGNLSGQLDKMLEGRLQIVNNFKDHPLYKIAKAKVYLMQACDSIAFGKQKSILLFSRAFNIHPSIVFSKLFIIYLSKLLSQKNMFK